MTTIKEIIQKIVEKMSYSNGYKKAWLAKHWGELVGEEAGRHSRPYKIEKDVLFVSVDSSVWNQELFMKRATLIVAINQKFSRKIVEVVKYQMGQFSIVAEETDVAGLDLLSSSDGMEPMINSGLDKSIMNRLQQKKTNYFTSRKLP